MIKKLYHRSFAIYTRVSPLLWVALFLVAIDVFARAGGGGRWSGGGGRRGGGGGGGDGAGAIIWLLINLIIRYPAIGIPLALIVIPALVYFSYKSKEGAQGYYQGRTIHRAHEMYEAAALDEGLGAIRRSDPAFNVGSFLARADAAFRKIQDAWCDQNLDAVRPFISDGIYERFSLQFNEQRDRGVRDHMENLNIHAKEIAEAEIDDTFETLSVRITASAIDYEVDAKTGKKTSGSKGNEVFTEYWTFIRKPGAQTTGAPGLIEGNCPNCGAALELNLSAKCDSCGSLIKSGEYDWVLSEITQASEWRPASKKRIAGVEAIREADPNFSVQQLEDRASVMFWRFIESLRIGKSAPIRKMATEFISEDLKGDYKITDDGMRHYFGECALASVDTLGIAIGDEMDQALLELRWSGARYGTDDMKKTKKIANTSISTNVFVLTRKHGASAGSGTLSSAHCPSCGAPVSNEASDACEYCGTVLNDGKTDWVLEHIGTAYDDLVQEVQSRFRSGVPRRRKSNAAAAAALLAADVGRPTPPEPGGLQLAGWMVKVMLADGKIDEEEEKLLVDYASSRNIPHSQLQEMVNSVHAGTFQAPEPRSPEEARSWLKSMASMALADGFVSSEEEAALLQLGQRLSYSAYDIKRIIKESRAELYQQSKEQLRAMRRS